MSFESILALIEDIFAKVMEFLKGFLPAEGEGEVEA